MTPIEENEALRQQVESLTKELQRSVEHAEDLQECLDNSDKKLATLTREHAAAVASCAVMREVLESISEPCDSIHPEECLCCKSDAVTLAQDALKDNCGQSLIDALAEAVGALESWCQTGDTTKCLDALTALRPFTQPKDKP